MDTNFYVTGDPDALLATLCPIDDAGFMLFGFAGRSRKPSEYGQLFAGSVEIVDYLMEGFVPYLLMADRRSDGIRLIVRKTGTNRDESVDWFVEKYIVSKGLAVTKCPA
jgi:hypothetical protein